MTATAIVGGQFGSEGKGLIVGHLAREFDVHVRVGAANAGHTLYTNDGRNYEPGQEGMGWEKHVMQQIPCAAYANPSADLYIGPGAQISPEIFSRELATLRDWREKMGFEPPIVHVDHRAHIIQPNQIEREKHSGLAARIGSTSTIAREGIGAAQADRVMREPWCCLAGDWVWEPNDSVSLTDVPLALATRTAHSILLEGTQGAGLSLTTGDFPYVTSRNTTAAGLCADVGIPPNELDEVGLIMRTYPIRVAGNSGPFHSGSTEVDWATIGIDPESERTTVTKLIRRVATFSMEQAIESCLLNGPSWIALTFCDYLDSEIAGVVSTQPFTHLTPWPEVDRLVRTIHACTGTPVRYLGTGPYTVIELDMG